MKTNTIIHLVVSLLFVHVLTYFVNAQTTYYWDSNGTTAGFGNTSGTWGTSTFWSSEILGTATPANTAITNVDSVFFGTEANAYNGTVTTDSALIANAITFGGSGTVNLSGAGTITLGNGTTGQGGFVRTGNGTTQINTNITLANSQTWTNSGTSALTIDNGGNRQINLGANNLTLSGAFAVNNNNDTFASLAGSGTLTKTGSGLAMIRGNNSGFTGNIVITGGSLGYGVIGSLGSGNIEINGGVLESRWQNNFSYAQGTGDGQVQITGGESGFAMNGNNSVTFNIGAITWGSATFDPTKFILQNANSQGNSALTLASAMDLNGADRTIVVGSGTTGNARAVISGAISNTTGTAGFIKEGDGRLQLTNAASAWNGNTTVSAGMLDMGGINLANIGGGSGRNITVADGASIRFNALSNAALNRLVETTAEIGVMTGSTANNIDFSSSSGANLANAFLGNYVSNGAKTEITGTITPGTDGYKFGARFSNGNLGIRSMLTGNHNLTVGQTGASGVRVTLTAANDFTGQTVINAGARLTLANNLAIQNSALNVGSAGGNIAFNAVAGGTAIVDATIANSPTFGGLIGSRNLSSVFTNSGGNNESNLTANLVTGFTLNVASGQSYTYTGGIGGFGTGTTSNSGGGTGGNSTLTKTGLGTQILGGTSTYTGVTTVSAGKLVINGSIASSTQTTVASGATLGGSGTVGALTISSGGFINPGNSPGILSVSGDYIQAGLYTAEIDGLTAGSGHDQISVTGAVDITNGSLTALFSGSYSANDLIFILLNDGSDAITGIYTDLAQGSTVTSYGGLNWNISYVADSDGNTFTGGNDIALQAVVIPEPKAALLSALGVLLLLRRRR